MRKVEENTEVEEINSICIDEIGEKERRYIHCIGIDLYDE